MIEPLVRLLVHEVVAQYQTTAVYALRGVLFVEWLVLVLSDNAYCPPRIDIILERERCRDVEQVQLRVLVL